MLKKILISLLLPYSVITLASDEPTGGIGSKLLSAVGVESTQAAVPAVAPILLGTLNALDKGKKAADVTTKAYRLYSAVSATTTEDIPIDDPQDDAPKSRVETYRPKKFYGRILPGPDTKPEEAAIKKKYDDIISGGKDADSINVGDLVGSLEGMIAHESTPANTIQQKNHKLPNMNKPKDIRKSWEYPEKVKSLSLLKIGMVKKESI